MHFIKKLFLPLTATLTFIQEHFKALLFLLLLFLLFAPSDESALKEPNLATLELSGAIFDAHAILEKIERLQKDERIEGVLLEVNSPGGAIAPSIEIAYAIKRLNETKPVIAYAGGIMASGSYYGSIWADKIYANPGAMIGSIGVIMQGANIEKLMQNIGIESQVVKAGKYKQVGTAERKWSEAERAELKKVITANYDMFCADVAKARDLNLSDRDKFADAHIFTAAQAKAAGLIDAVATIYEAKEALIKRSGVDEPVWQKEDRFERFFKRFAAKSAALLQIYFPALSVR